MEIGMGLNNNPGKTSVEDGEKIDIAAPFVAIIVLSCGMLFVDIFAPHNLAHTFIQMAFAFTIVFAAFTFALVLFDRMV